MKKVLSMFVVLLMSTMMWGANSSVPENAPDVMLQAFYWDSYPSNSSNLGYGNTGWSALLNQADELGEYFDLVWLPPCSQSSGGTGYIPKQYSNLNSDWGSETQLRELISKLKAKNTRCVADVVVNHITGNYGWCSFATMDFGDYGKFYPEASWICQTDEMNYEASAGTCQGKATGANDDGYGDEANYTAARDWDHKNSQVQAMCRAYLKWLKNDVGFDGWRYDYGKGFHHSHINDYNSAAGAYMSVVEYWDGNPGVIRSRLEDAQWNNMAFDFGTKYDAINNGICSFNYGKCKGAGLLGAGLSKHAVTFVDNHDTFTRNDSEFGGQNNSMSSNLKDRLLQANAFILSMPGIPCVFYPHWVTYKSEIKAMIEARHLVGVHSQSEVKDESAEQGGYQATIVGKNGWLILQLGNKVGGSFDGFSKKASGNGYAIWVKTNTVDAFYITGNAVLVGDKAWKADAIKVTGNTYTFSNLAAGKDYQLKVTVDGTWNTAKGFSDLTTTADGLSGDNDGNICFSLSEAGDVKVTYTGAVFKLEGKFATSGSGSGEEQTTTKFYITGNDLLVGESKAWNPAAIASTEDSYTIENLTTGKDYKMKITTDGTWNTAKGFSNLTTTADGLSGDNDGNICFSLSEAGSVKVTYTSSVFKVEGKFVTAGSGSGDEPVDSVTVYFVNTLSWAKVNAFVWPASGNPLKAWPGEAMKKEADKLQGFDVYSYKFPKTYVNIIFNDGTKQTVDLTWAESKPYFYPTGTESSKVKGTWYAKADVPSAGGGSGDDPQPVDSVTVYFLNTINWAKVNAFVWPASGDPLKAWPGEAMKKEADKLQGFDVYSYKFPKTYVNIIFNDGTKQTVDLTWAESKPYFYPTETNSEGKYKGEWYAKADVPAAVVPAKFYITGDSALVVDAGLEKAKAWNADAIKSETDTFELSLKADQYYVLKVTLNGTWEGENNVMGYNELTEKTEGLIDDGNDHNIGFKLSEAGKVQVIYTTDKDNKTIFKLVGKFVTEGSGSGDDPQPGAAKFYITGDSALVVDAGLDKAKAWNADAIKSEADTFELSLKADQYYVLKVTLNGTWEGENNVKGYNELTEKTEGLDDVSNDHNIGFKLSEAGKVQVIYTTDIDNKTIFKLAGKFVTEGSGSGDDPQPGAAKFYITGDSALVVDAGLDKAKAWNPAAIKSETDTFELSLKADQYYVLKVTLNGTWEDENNVKGYNELTEKTEGLDDVSNDHNIGFKLSEAGKVQVIYTIDKDNKTIFKLAGKFVTEGSGSGDDPQPGTKYFMKNNWNGGAEWSWKEMTAAENNTFKLEKVVFGGMGVNYNTAESDEGAEWVAIDALDGDEIGALDTVTFVLDLAAEKKVKAILLGKYNEGQGGGDDPQPGENVTVYFVNNVNWETVNAYVWVGESDVYKQWPGEALTKETAQAGVAKREAEQHQGYDIYSYTFPSKYVNIIFNNGSVQTVDLTWNAAKPYFYPDGAEGSKVKGTWYAKEEIPSGGEPIVKPEDGYYLLGTFNSWTPAAEYLFKANPDKANEYYLSVTLAVDDKLKVAKVENGATKTWYPDGMDNDYVVDAAHAGAKVIYFQTTYNAEWEAFGGYFYIASDTGTGLDNSQAGATYQKFIENGQLFILRDGRIYTPAGQFVR